MAEVNPNTPLWQLTAGQLIELLQQSNKSQPEVNEPEEIVENSDLIYGLSGLAKFLNCSVTWAAILKNDKKIFSDETIIQKGRKIMFIKSKVLEDYKNWNHEK